MAQERILISSDWGKVTAELIDNGATQSLVQILPLTIEMRSKMKNLFAQPASIIPTDPTVEGGETGESRAPSHRLLDLRFRHPIRFHRPWPDHTDSAIAWRVWGNRLAPDSRFPQVARHQRDLVHPWLHHRKLAARMRGGRRG